MNIVCLVGETNGSGTMPHGAALSGPAAVPPDPNFDKTVLSRRKKIQQLQDVVEEKRRDVYKVRFADVMFSG